MSGVSPNFEHWRQFATLHIWEIAALMAGVDPRAVGDAGWRDDDPLSDEIRSLISAATVGELPTVSQSPESIDSKTQIAREPLIKWLRRLGKSELADRLVIETSTISPNNPEESQRGGSVQAVTDEESTSGDVVARDPEDDSQTETPGWDFTGCKQTIMLNWDEIKKATRNPRPNARDVEHYLRRHPEIEECRGKKNRQNCISELRRKKLI